MLFWPHFLAPYDVMYLIRYPDLTRYLAQGGLTETATVRAVSQLVNQLRQNLDGLLALL